MILDITADLRDVAIMPTSELEEIAQNVQMIIATVKGSVPLDRSFGIEAGKLDAPIARAQAKLSAEIASAVREQEPRARVQKVFYSGDPNDGQLIATVRIEVVEKNLRGGVFL